MSMLSLVVLFVAAAFAQVKVIIVGSADDAFRGDIVGKISGAGFTVAFFDAKIATPTLADLNPHDVAFVYTDTSQDSVALGDVLADFVDSGKPVVVALGSMATGFAPRGRWATGGYGPIADHPVLNGDGPHTLVPVIPGHPLLAGVNSFSGGALNFRTTATTVESGAVRVADWSTGQVLIATFDTKFVAKVVALVFFPASDDVFPGLWDASTDGAQIMANALNYAFITTVVDDPHISGAHGIKFDVFGVPGANYSLVVAPAFEVNMQLATRGPEMRFMTAMTVLYRGKSFTITPRTVKAKSAELITHFESLGSKISINNERITIELCAAHTISIEAQHSKIMSYLNFEMQVPGCHNSYGGLLGQTYKCKYATEKFKWSREREKAFRLATLSKPSGSYSADVECAHEDEYIGKPMRGGSFSKDTDAL
jgi:hypothetical protein